MNVGRQKLLKVLLCKGKSTGLEEGGGTLGAASGWQVRVKGANQRPLQLEEVTLGPKAPSRTQAGLWEGQRWASSHRPPGSKVHQ